MNFIQKKKDILDRIKNNKELFLKPEIFKIGNNDSNMIETGEVTKFIDTEHGLVIASGKYIKIKLKEKINKINKNDEINKNEEIDKNDSFDNFSNIEPEKKKKIIILGRHDNKFITCIKYNKKTSILYSGGFDGVIKIWDLKKKIEIGILGKHSYFISCLALIKKSNILISCGRDEKIKLWDLKQNKKICILGKHDVTCLILYESRNLLFSGGWDEKINMWDIKEKKFLGVLGKHTGYIYCMVLLKKRNVLFSAGEDKKIKIWDLSSFRFIGKLGKSEDFIYCMLLAKKKNIMFSGGYNKKIKMWNMDNFEEIGILGEHDNFITCLQLSNDKEILYSGGKDKKVRVWRMANNSEIVNFKDGSNLINCIVIDKKNDILYSGGYDKKIKIWDLKTKKQIGILGTHEDSVKCMIISKSKKTLYSGGRDKKIRIWKLIKNDKKISHKNKKENEYKKNELGILGQHDGFVYCLVLSETHELLFSGGKDKKIILWNLANNTKIGVLGVNDKSIYCLALSKNNYTLFSGGYDKKIKMWNILNNQNIGVLGEHDDFVTCLVFSNKKNFLFSGGWDGKIKIWNMLNKTEIGILGKHNGYVNCMVLSENKDILFSSGGDRKIRMWNLVNKTQIFFFDAKEVNCLVLSKDHNILYDNNLVARDIQKSFFIDKLYFQNLFLINSNNNKNEDKFLKLVKFYEKYYYSMYLTRFCYNPIFICIIFEYSKVLKYILTKKIMKYSDCNTLQISPLILALHFKNDDIIKILFEYLKENKFKSSLSYEEMKYLFHFSHPLIDNFLTFLPQRIKKFKNSDIYIPSQTYIKKIKIVHNYLPGFEKSQFSNKWIDNDNWLINEEQNKNKNLHETFFYTLNFPYNFVLGSEDSLLFLKKYKTSQNPSFILSEFRHIINNKWKKIRKIVLILAFIFWTHALVFSIYLLNNNLIFFLVIDYLLLIILLFIEVFSFLINKKYYFTVLYNYLDILVIIFSFISLVLSRNKDNINLNSLVYIDLFSITIVHFRSFFYLEVFDSFRHLINMIIGVTRSIFTTLFVFIYILLTFSILFTKTNGGFTFTESVKINFISIFGELPEEDSENPMDFSVWVLIVIMGMMTSLILSNFLIAIMSSEFNKLELEQTIISLKGKAELIEEIETLFSLFYRRKIFKPYYLTILTTDGDHKNNNINKIKKKRKKRIRKKQMREKIDELITIKKSFDKQFEKINDIGFKVNKIDEDMKFRMERLEKKFDDLKMILSKVLERSN